jgi:glycosyltransferase involved in cell wall biosynthesis
MRNPASGTQVALPSNSVEAGSVVMVCEACGKGVARHIQDLSVGLLQRNWNVALVYSPTLMDGMFADGLKRLGSHRRFRAIPCPMTHAPSYGDIHVMKEIALAISQFGADVVHCHCTKAGLVGRISAAWLGVPCVYTPHAMLCMSPHLPSAIRSVVGWFEAVFGRWLSHMIAVSEEEKAYALHIGVPAGRVRAVPNGVITSTLPTARERTECRMRLGLADDDVCAGFVGRISRQKAVDNLLHSCRLLRSHGVERFKIVIVGDGPLRPEMEALSRKLDVDDMLIWAGEQPGAAIMPAFDMFVLSSDYEGMPYVLLEAMAAGLPIVATDVGGVRALVADGENGRIVPRREPSRLAHALDELRQFPELRSRMGASSRSRVAEFSVERMVDGVVDLYNSLRGIQPA